MDTCFDVAMAARERLAVGGAVDDDDCDVAVVRVGARGSSKMTDVLLAVTPHDVSALACDASDVDESVRFDLWYFFAVSSDDDVFLSSRMWVPPLPCLLPRAACRPPLEADVDELPAEEGVLYGGGDSDGKSSGSAAT
jgi:hypothetical protein